MTLIELGIGLIELGIGLIELGIGLIEQGIGLMELGIILRIDCARRTVLARVSDLEFKLFIFSPSPNPLILFPNSTLYKPGLLRRLLGGWRLGMGTSFRSADLAHSEGHLSLLGGWRLGMAIL